MRAGILLIVLYWALFTIRAGLQPKVAAEVKAATYAGTRATLTVTEYGFTFDGPPEEVEQIRERRCLK